MLCESRHSLKVESRTQMMAVNRFALFGFLVTVALWLATGFSLTFFAVSTSLSFVSLLLRSQYSRRLFEPRPLEPALTPFESIRDLAQVQRETSFRKRKVRATTGRRETEVNPILFLATLSVLPFVPLLLVGLCENREERATVVLAS